MTREKNIEAFAAEFNLLCKKYNVRPCNKSEKQFETLMCSFVSRDRVSADYRLYHDDGKVFTLSEPWPG